MRIKVKSIIRFMISFLVLAVCVILVNTINAQQTMYKIGQKGPAGGWIFYDKGNYDGGWRYLEAAPQDQGMAKWGFFS